MASPVGRASSSVERLLFEEPYRFEFFQAVRLLGRLFPDRARVGLKGPPGREVVRFHARASLAFPASAIARLEPGRGADGPLAMTVAFMGLTGPSGVLPHHYTEFLLDGNTEAAAFLDLFNHRLIALFFRAWEKYRPALAREAGAPDLLKGCLLAFVGRGTEGLQERYDFSDDAFLCHASAFAQRRRPALVLERLLRDYFGLNVEVEQFVGRWLVLDPADRSTLNPEGGNNGLGTSLLLGGRVWDAQGKFRLRVGPLTEAQFLALLPGGDDFRALAQMTRAFVDLGLDFDVQLVLKAEEVPQCRLSSAAGAGSQLGRHAWLRARPMTADAGDAVFPAPI